MGRETTSRFLRCQKGHVPETIFEDGGPLPGPEGVRRDMYWKRSSRVGDHFQVLKVSEGTMGNVTTLIRITNIIKYYK